MPRKHALAEWDSNYITPYAGPAMCTTRYSHGIARRTVDTEVMSGTPNTTLKNASEYSYSVSISYPAGLSFSFGWNGSAGTKIQAGIRPEMHDIVFSNPAGIFGTEENGAFQYDTITLFTVPKHTQFKFQFNQVIFNAVYGNESGMQKHGDYWELVVPELMSSGGGGNVGSYIRNGIDYSLVFDPVYYLNKYPDLQAALGNNYAAAFDHFINNGMSEARQASAAFNVVAYRNRYLDLQQAFGDDWRRYYIHYIQSGIGEGRIGN